MDYQCFVEKVKEFEGFRAKAYSCPSGVLSIGYGHTHGVTKDMTVTPSIAVEFLHYDLLLVQQQLYSFHKWYILDGNIPSFGVRLALIDFVFNVGFTKYKNSSLCKKYISQGNYNLDGISCQLLQWTRSNGKVLKGLEKRRAWEVSLIYEK